MTSPACHTHDVRMAALALAVLLTTPVVEAGAAESARAGRPKKKPEKRPPVKPPAAPCADGKPTAEQVELFVTGDGQAAAAVKKYAATCRSWAETVGKDLYLRGYTLKEDKPDEAIVLLKRSLEVTPRDSDTADKARALASKLEKSRRD